MRFLTVTFDKGVRNVEVGAGAVRNCTYFS